MVDYYEWKSRRIPERARDPAAAEGQPGFSLSVMASTSSCSKAAAASFAEIALPGVKPSN
jgi:hypothetical protein